MLRFIKVLLRLDTIAQYLTGGTIRQVNVRQNAIHVNVAVYSYVYVTSYNAIACFISKHTYTQHQPGSNLHKQLNLTRRALSTPLNAVLVDSNGSAAKGWGSFGPGIVRPKHKHPHHRCSNPSGGSTGGS